LALAALIAAYHESGEPGHLRATLPLAGRTVIERQARLAASAGASPILILVERMPAALSAAIGRLRRDHVPIQVVRSAEEAAEAVDPYDRVLLVADGAIAGRSQLARVAAAEGNAVLTVKDGAQGEPYERIDAAERWAGIAGIDGALLRETAAMLRDWDLQSTLLRRALQSGAEHLPAEGAVAILNREADLERLEREIVAGADQPGEGWLGRLLAPLERLGTTFLLGSSASPQVVGLGAAALTGLGAAAFYGRWYWTGLVMMIAATPLEGIARRLARLRMQDGVGQGWWHHVLELLAATALIVLAYDLAPAWGWGMILAAFVALAFLHALDGETRRLRVRGALFLAERKGMIWLMLPFALFGLWHVGIGALAAYAALSFFWAQREAHAVPAPRQD
jgi:hypothetical protein